MKSTKYTKNIARNNNRFYEKTNWCKLEKSIEGVINIIIRNLK